jgi:hypothetical protein
MLLVTTVGLAVTGHGTAKHLPVCRTSGQRARIELYFKAEDGYYRYLYHSKVRVERQEHENLICILPASVYNEISNSFPLGKFGNTLRSHFLQVQSRSKPLISLHRR